MAEKVVRRIPAQIPQFGWIEGGLLDGWLYAFERVTYEARTIFIDLRVTQPHWPFGRTVRFGPKSFKRLRGGFRAPRHHARPLFEAARELAKTRKKKNAD